MKRAHCARYSSSTPGARRYSFSAATKLVNGTSGIGSLYRFADAIYDQYLEESGEQGLL